jgi:flagellin
MTILMNNATAANIGILRKTNELFDTAQKRVASGRKVSSAVDDAQRYRTSERLLSRSTQLSDINANISLGLSALEATDKTLTQMIGLVNQAIDLTTKAQNEGTVGARSATATAPLDSASVVSGISVGSKFSITTDDGRNFTYTFASTTTTWGQVINALNASNIGIQGDFIPAATAGQTNLRFTSTSGKDFTFDGTSDENAMDDLAGMVSPSGQTFTPVNLFANGLAAPAAGETGFSIAYGGRIIGNAGGGVTLATSVAAGSSLVFVDGNGANRTLNYGVATPLSQVITDINGLGAGVKADLINQSGGAGGPLQLRIRNTNGGNFQVINATGDFALGGSLGLGGTVTGYATSLSSNNALRLSYGQQYDDIILAIDALVANNPVPNGRNLLQGNTIAINLDEFTSDPIRLVGSAVTAASTLTMAQAGASWANDININTSATQARAAEGVLRSLQAQYATFNSYIKSRYDLNQTFQSEMKTQGDDVVAADVTEESAALVALQTRQQFAVQSLSISNQNSQAMLKLFG